VSRRSPRDGRAVKRRKHRAAPKRFLVVARTSTSEGWPHPVEVGIHPDGRNSVVSFSIGPHVVNAGGLVPLANVLDASRTGLNPMFAMEFEAARLDWLVPLLVRLHAGEDVKDEIEAAYRELHGGPPEWMQ
jgi:hypothetical protein